MYDLHMAMYVRESRELRELYDCGGALAVGVACLGPVCGSWEKVRQEMCEWLC